MVDWAKVVLFLLHCKKIANFAVRFNEFGGAPFVSGAENIPMESDPDNAGVENNLLIQVLFAKLEV